MIKKLYRFRVDTGCGDYECVIVIAESESHAARQARAAWKKEYGEPLKYDRETHGKRHPFTRAESIHDLSETVFISVSS